MFARVESLERRSMLSFTTVAQTPSGFPRRMAIVGDDLYFLIDPEINQSADFVELRRLNLGRGRQELVTPADGSNWDLGAASLFAAGGQLLVETTSALWSVGANGGATHLADELSPNKNHRTGKAGVMSGGYFYFPVSVENEGLWRTDFTAAGTTKVFDHDQSQPGSPSDLSLTPAGLYFLDEWRLYKSNGTQAEQLKVFAGSKQRSIRDLMQVGSRLFFTADPVTTGHTLWSTDGSPGSAKPIAGDFPIDAELLGAAGQYVVFSARTADAGKELWIADPVKLSSKRVTDLVAGSADGITGSVRPLQVGNDLYLAHVDEPFSGICGCSNFGNIPEPPHAPDRVIRVDGETGKARIIYNGLATEFFVVAGRILLRDSESTQFKLVTDPSTPATAMGLFADAPVVSIDGRTLYFADGAAGRRIVSYQPGLGHVNIKVSSDRDGNGQPDGTLGGFSVFADYDRDGRRDSNEPLEQVSSSGIGSLTNVQPGSTLIRIREATDSYRSTSPAAVEVNVVGGAFSNVQFLQQPLVGRLKVTVFSDANRNGVQDTREAGIPSARILFDHNRDGEESFDELGFSTKESGVSRTFEYPIADPIPLQLVVRDEWYPTTPDAVVSKLRDEKTTHVKFGVFRDPHTSALRGRVFSDRNRNGVQDAGEDGMSSVSIALYSDAGFVRAVRTAGDGSYRFGGLPAGNYTARTSAAFADYYDVLPGRRQSARLGPADRRTRNFAVYSYMRTASISGVVFNDQNGDGKRNTGEPAVAQIRVFIDENENGVFDAHEPTSISTHTGRFAIVGVRSGWNLVDAFDSRNAFYNSYGIEPYVQVVDGAALEQRIALWRW